MYMNHDGGAFAYRNEAEKKKNTQTNNKLSALIKHTLDCI